MPISLRLMHNRRKSISSVNAFRYPRKLWPNRTVSWPSQKRNWLKPKLIWRASLPKSVSWPPETRNSCPNCRRPKRESRKRKADSNPPPTQRLTPDTSTPEHPISDHRPNIRKDSDNAAPPTATATTEDDPATDTASTNVSALPTSTMPGPQSDEPNNNVSEHAGQAVRLILTSSLGKHLDANRIAPNATLPVIVQPISGGQTDSILDLLIQEDTPCMSVSILVGGNDIANGSTVSTCMENFENMIYTVRSKNKNCTINFIEIPERSAPTRVNRNIYDLNHELFDMCNSPYNTDCFFFRNGVINENQRMFAQDGVHLSYLGTAKLAMTLCHTVLRCESSWSKGLSPDVPSQSQQIKQDVKTSPVRHQSSGNEHQPQRPCTNLARKVTPLAVPIPTRDRVPTTRNDLLLRITNILTDTKTFPDSPSGTVGPTKGHNPLHRTQTQMKQTRQSSNSSSCCLIKCSDLCHIYEPHPTSQWLIWTL